MDNVFIAIQPTRSPHISRNIHVHVESAETFSLTVPQYNLLSACEKKHTYVMKILR